MPIQDVVAELNRITRAGLISDYAIGGAIAAQAYIETSSTEDIDVFVIVSGPEANSLMPLNRVWADLVQHGAKQLDGGYLEIGGWPVQLLLPPAQPLYDEAVRAANAKDFGGGLDGRIMLPLHLAGIALATGRAKDYLRVEEFLKRGKVERADIEELVQRFGLTPAWDSFRKRFLNEQ